VAIELVELWWGPKMEGLYGRDKQLVWYWLCPRGYGTRPFAPKPQSSQGMDVLIATGQLRRMVGEQNALAYIAREGARAYESDAQRRDRTEEELRDKTVESGLDGAQKRAAGRRAAEKKGGG
jgi:hypothetical protein